MIHAKDQNKRYQILLSGGVLEPTSENPMQTTYQYGGQITANGIRQHYIRYGGTGTPILLIPGITSPAATWGSVADRLGRKYDTYVLDMRGRGLSQGGGELDYSLDACAADATAIADALALPDYIFLGHSMGARIGIRAARRPDSRVQKLILVDPPVTGPGRRPYPISLDWILGAVRTAAQGTTLEAMRTFLPTWKDEDLRLRAEWIPTCNIQSVEVAYAGFHTDDIHADVPHLKVPTLLVVAGKGVILPEEAEEIRRLLPSIQIERVERAGHLIPWDDFEGFFVALAPVLGKI